MTHQAKVDSPTLQSLLEQASSYLKRGQLHNAESVYQQICQHQPGNALAWRTLGIIKAKLGVLDSAKTCLYKALEIDQSDSEALFNLGKIHHLQHKQEKAKECYRHCIAHDARHAGAYIGLGAVMLDENNTNAAKRFLKQAIELKPNSSKAYYHLGYAYHLQNDLDNAVIHYREALKLNPDYYQAHSNLGAALRSKRQLEGAVHHLDAAVRLHPRDADAHNNLAAALYDSGDIESAVSHYREAIIIKPDHHQAYNNLGSVFFEQERFNEALNCFKQSRHAKPDFHEAVYNIGRVYQEMGDLQEASRCYSHAIALKNDYAKAHWNLSEIFMRQGEVERGWEKYEWRQAKLDLDEQPHHGLNYPVWDGSDLSGKTLLIQAEQGLGDEIRFASCFPDVIARAEHCLIECDRRLIPLYRRAFPSADLFVRNDGGELRNIMAHKKIDYRVAAGSLPRFLRNDLRQFPQHTGYLYAEPERVEEYAQYLSSLGKGLKVGISWRSSRITRLRQKMYTRLEQWQPIFKVANVQFINLQYDDCREELERIRRMYGITIHRHPHLDPMADIDGFAAMINALNLIIVPANSVGTLAGALGKPVWKLSLYGGDWSSLGTDYAPWFPSMRLFMQPRPGDWDSIMAAMADELEQLANGRRPATPGMHIPTTR